MVRRNGSSALLPQTHPRALWVEKVGRQERTLRIGRIVAGGKQLCSNCTVIVIGQFRIRSSVRANLRMTSATRFCNSERPCTCSSEGNDTQLLIAKRSR